MIPSHEHLEDASLVWAFRRIEIQQLLVEDFPTLREGDIASIVCMAAMYSTCSNERFERYMRELDIKRRDKRSDATCKAEIQRKVHERKERKERETAEPCSLN